MKVKPTDIDPTGFSSGQAVGWDGSVMGPITASGGGGGSGTLLGMQVFTSGSGTYTPTTGTTNIVIEMVGGGGGGSAVPSPGSGLVYLGAGGGAGAYLRKRLTANFSGASYSVGAAGAGGAAGANNGAAGGSTTFTDTAGSPTTYTAGGGSGGGRNGAFAPPFVCGIVSGGTATNGDLNVLGGSGSVPVTVNGNNHVSGSGGACPFSPGSPARVLGTATGNSAGGAAAGYGGGGSGAVASGATVAAAGGSGSAGVIVIWEYGSSSTTGRMMLSSNTSQTPVAGAWNTHNISDVIHNDISGASLAGNVITLPSGTYIVRGQAAGIRTNSTRLRLRNTTDGANLCSGLTVWGGNATGTGVGAVVNPSIFGKFTLAASKSVELQQWMDAVSTAFSQIAFFGDVGTYGSNGMNAELLIEKIA